MYKKVIIQLLLLLVLFVIIISVFLLYFNDESINNKTKSNTPIETIEKVTQSEIDKETGTLIKDIAILFQTYLEISMNFFLMLGK